MKVFLDSSVLLRKLLGEPHPLKEWKRIEEAYVSRMLVIEVGRSIDRYRLVGRIDDEEVVTLHRSLQTTLASFTILRLTEHILDRAAEPMPTVLGSLDAVHLATALALRAVMDDELVFATHDTQLANAASAMRFSVIGL